MPIIQINLHKDKYSEEKIVKIISGVTKVFTDLGTSENAVRVIIHEIPKTHWGIAGKPASEILSKPD